MKGERIKSELWGPCTVVGLPPSQERRLRETVRENNKLIRKLIHESQRAQLWPTGEKPCSHCGSVLPFTHFYEKRESRGGLTARCKKCIWKLDSSAGRGTSDAARQAKANWKKRNRELVLLQQRNRRRELVALGLGRVRTESDRESSRRQSKKEREALNDHYIRTRLGITKDAGEKFPELVEAKRLHLQIRRLLKEQNA